jgi:starch phosphorylase
LARSRWNFDDHGAFQATALSLRDRLIEKWNDTQEYYLDKKVKRVYYFSIEYLLGRALSNTISNLNLKNEYTQVTHKEKMQTKTNDKVVKRLTLLCLKC